MRTKVTLFLLFLNVALCFFIFTFVRRGGAGGIYDASRRRVLGPEAASIQSIEIAGGRLSQPVRMEKRAEGWMIVSPIEWPANLNAVDGMLNELQLMEHQTSFPVRELAKSNRSLADYGLDRPRMILSFMPGQTSGLAAGAPRKGFVLRVGDTTEVGNRLYLLSPDGERIHVVDRHFIEIFGLTLQQLESDAIFNIPLFELRSFNVQTAAPANLRIRLRREGPRWLFEAPILTRADRTQVELAVNGLYKLRTLSLLEPAAAPADQTGLANPTFRLTFEGNGRRETLLLGNPAGAAPAAGQAPAEPSTSYFAKMEDRAPVFTVLMPNKLFETLRNAQAELRDKHLLSFDSRALRSITISAPNRPELTLQRLETGQQPLDTDPWQIVTRVANQAPQTLPADLPLVQRLVQQLGLLQAVRFLRDAPQAIDVENWGFNRPEREISLNFVAGGSLSGGSLGAAANSSSVTLQIGVASERDNQAYARRIDEPFVYIVDPEILRETPVAVSYYRDRLLKELPAGARITALALTDIASKTPIFSRQLAADETWEQALAAETEPRRAAVRAVLEQLRSLRAQSFVLDSFPPSVEVAGEPRAWKYALEATISLVGGSGAQTDSIALSFTERTGGATQLAGSAKLNVVFVANQKLIDALFALTNSPAPAVTAAPPAPVSPAPAAASSGR